MHKSDFPCASHESMENDSAGPSNLPIPWKPFCSYRPTHRCTHRLIPAQFSPYSNPDKTAAVGPGEERPHWKIAWRSIRQFSVGSAADTWVIYSEGAAAMIGSEGVCMLVDILPYLPNLILNAGHDKRLLHCPRAVQSYNPPHTHPSHPVSFQSLSNLFPVTGQSVA